MEENLKGLLLEGELKKVLLISSSNNQLDLEKGSYIGGIRETSRFKMISVIVRSEASVRELVRYSNDRVSYFFVEAEKKLPYEFKSNNENQKLISNSNFSNLYQSAFEELELLNCVSKLYKWKPSDLTVKSAINFIRKWERIKRPRQISIIGLGNIGSKVALSLLEEGIKVKAINRTHSKGEAICHGINKMVSKYTIARIIYFENIEACIAESDVLINCASSTKFIDPQIFNIMKKPSLFLDIGKNALLDDYIEIDQTTFLRCDISEEIKKFVTSELLYNHLEIPRILTMSNGNRYIEPGILGRPGDILVGDINDLSSRIGIINSDLRLNYD